MGIEEQCASLKKEIEKLIRQLTDGTPLTFQKRAEKQNRITVLRQQILALQSQLPGQGVKKVIHQYVSMGRGLGSTPPSSFFFCEGSVQ